MKYMFITFALLLSFTANARNWSEKETQDLMIALGNPYTDTVPGPMGYYEYCERNANSIECGGKSDHSEFKPANLADLQYVNKTINNSMTYVVDKLKYGKAEYWTDPVDFKGDCDDYALKKLHMLYDMGWNPENLRIAIGEYHVKGWDMKDEFVFSEGADWGKIMGTNDNNTHALIVAAVNGTYYALDMFDDSIHEYNGYKAFYSQLISVPGTTDWVVSKNW